MLLDIAGLEALDLSGSSDVIDQFDINADGSIDIQDCPYSHGSLAAKLWWKKVMEPVSQDTITSEMRAEYGDRVVGSYKSKPRVPGEVGAGQADFEWMVDRLRVTRGLTEAQAKSIAGAAKVRMYG